MGGKKRDSSRKGIYVIHRMGFLSYLGILFLLFIILAVLAGVYLYNYHVFKTIRICEGDLIDTNISCNYIEDCFEEFGLDYGSFEIDGFPEFVQPTAQGILDRNFYCDRNCMIGSVRGVDFATKEFEDIDTCNLGERETVIELRGKELLEIYSYVRENHLLSKPF